MFYYGDMKWIGGSGQRLHDHDVFERTPVTVIVWGHNLTPHLPVLVSEMKPSGFATGDLLTKSMSLTRFVFPNQLI